jgi:acyl carrier protein
VNDRQDAAREVIGVFLARHGKAHDDLTNDVMLFGGGLELDSLEAAELSAELEDALGSDPFSSGATPKTIGDVVGFFAVRSNA